MLRLLVHLVFLPIYILGFIAEVALNLLNVAFGLAIIGGGLGCLAGLVVFLMIVAAIIGI